MIRKLFVLAAILTGLLAVAACMFVAIQFVPTGVSTDNPPVVAEPAWDSAQTRALAQQACFDCHSNETQWPWYVRVAPMSWLAARDVVEGRQALNFSEWGVARSSRGEGDEAGESGEQFEEVIEVVQEGAMPPASYELLHPNARLTAAERQQLVEGLQKTLN